jgi:hypothetical protein
MNNTQIEANAGRRAELRNANEKALKYLVDETKAYDRQQFEKEANDGDRALSNSLFAILLREVIEVHPEGDSYMFMGNSFNKLEVPPEAILTALKDLKKFQAEDRKHCRECGAPKEEQKKAA